MPKNRNRKVRGDKVIRGGPLANQILDEEEVKGTGRTKNRKRRTDGIQFVESDLSKKILSEALTQQQELEEEHGPSVNSGKAANKQKKFILQTAPKDDSDDQLEDSMAAQEGMLGIVDIDPEEERIYDTFLGVSKTTTEDHSLADVIDDKVSVARTEVETVLSDGPNNTMDIDPKVVALLEKVGDILNKYRSGKLPKLFKKLPAYDKWEQALQITKPTEWSAAAMYAATKIFASNLSAHLAQRFYSKILLPRIRDDIHEFKRLNFHLMLSLKKALFKTSAFFKGILLPLCESGDCTLREAIIISSVLRESSIPIQHSGATIDRIARMHYTGANSIFLRTLLDKKYALAYVVIDAVLEHFVSFTNRDCQLPVLWHQSLLTFVQRYKSDLTEEQKQQLYAVIRAHHHHEISPEVRRELENSACRSAGAAAASGSDVAMT